MGDPRLHARLSLDYADSPKIDALSDKAFRAHIKMILWSRRLTTDGRIPAKFVRNFGTIRVINELLSNDEIAPSLIKIGEDYWLHDFLEHQSSKAEIQSIIEKNRVNGAKGGLAKAKRVASESLQNPTLAKPWPKDKDKDKETTTDVVVKTLNAELDILPSATFDDFWAQWPRKESKPSAVKAWDRAVRRTPPDQIVAAARAYSDNPNRPEKQFIPHPATWLNGDRWADELRGPDARSQPRSNMDGHRDTMLMLRERDEQQERDRTQNNRLEIQA